MAHDSNGDPRPADRSQTNDSRRRFLAGSAGAIGAISLGGAFGAQSVLADDDDDEETEDGTETEEPTEEGFEDDVAILNYALTLEHLEATFYRRALENVEDGTMPSDPFEQLRELVAEPIIAHFRLIQAHEETHVEFLTGVVESLGGEPAESPEFDFGSAVEDPREFLATAAALEDTGVAAYAGAAPSIENEDLVPPALGIHSVEARHASFVRTLAGELGFPNAFDEPLPRDEVLAIASRFIVSDEEDDEAAETPTEEDDGETPTEEDAEETLTEDVDEETDTPIEDDEEEETPTEDY